MCLDYGNNNSQRKTIKTTADTDFDSAVYT